MSEEIELKPCPFCGNEARLHQEALSPLNYSFFVDCSQCEAEMGDFDRPEEAAEQWNRRVTDG